MGNEIIESGQVVNPELSQEATTITNVKEIIASKVKTITTLKEELKDLKSDYTDRLMENPTYRSYKTDIEELKKKAKQLEETLCAETDLGDLKDEIKDLKDDIKEDQEMLSTHLVYYTQKSGQMTFLDHMGEEREIKLSAKVK